MEKFGDERRAASVLSNPNTIGVACINLILASKNAPPPLKRPGRS